MLRRRGKDLVAIVPMEDLALIERLEDEIDVRRARRALSEMKRKGKKPVPLAELTRELGLSMAYRVVIGDSAGREIRKRSGGPSSGS